MCFFISLKSNELYTHEINGSLDQGVGTVKFQVKQLKTYRLNLLNFLHFQPLTSGEGAALPVPTPLSITSFREVQFHELFALLN